MNVSKNEFLMIWIFKLEMEIIFFLNTAFSVITSYEICRAVSQYMHIGKVIVWVAESSGPYSLCSIFFVIKLLEYFHLRMEPQTFSSEVQHSSYRAT